MKITFRIPHPTIAYAYVEIEQEAHMSPVPPGEIVDEFNSLNEAFKIQSGLPEKEFNAMLDEYLSTKTIVNGQDRYEKLSPAQRDVLQAIKRSYARLKK